MRLIGVPAEAPEERITRQRWWTGGRDTRAGVRSERWTALGKRNPRVPRCSLPVGLCPAAVEDDVGAAWYSTKYSWRCSCRSVWPHRRRRLVTIAVVCPSQCSVRLIQHQAPIDTRKLRPSRQSCCSQLSQRAVPGSRQSIASVGDRR